MPELQDHSTLIREFFSQSLMKEQVAFLYLGYSGIILRIKDGAIAVDPSNLLGDRALPAFSRLDLLLFTHSHYDHYNRALANKLLENTNAHIVAPKQVAEDLKDRISLDRMTVASHGLKLDINGFRVTPFEGVHPRPITIYKIEKDAYSIFHAGDSGYSPIEGSSVKLAFLPTGRPSPSCSPENALKFVRDLKPIIAVAMHGTQLQMIKFRKLVEKDTVETSVIIPKEYKIETVVP
ncbi:MAG: MBL fold metallo-hydrolase [Candidatus Bathyarchaeota archaeon]|nr:MAG: MBL fold metallo-hydrolase [Candidatus Bathyarchaeota archaeon]